MKYKSLMYLLMLGLLSWSEMAVGQLKNYNTENNVWYPGQVNLSNGGELKGSVNYNFITGILSIKSSEESNSYTAKNVLNFSYKDSALVLRKYYALDFEVKRNKEPAKIFFEVVFEGKSSAILSRHEYDYHLGDSRVPGSSNFGSAPTITTESEKVTEVIYVASSKGEILEFGQQKKDKTIKLVDDTEDRYDGKRYKKSKTARLEGSKYKVTNKDALSLIAGIDYHTMTSQFEKKGNKIDTVEELILFVKFCEQQGL